MAPWVLSGEGVLRDLARAFIEATKGIHVLIPFYHSAEAELAPKRLAEGPALPFQFLGSPVTH